MHALATHPPLEAGRGERPGRFHDRPGVVEDVLDGRTDFVVADEDDFVDRLARQGKRQFAHLPNGDTIGEDADVIEAHATPLLERSIHGVGFEGLHADHLHVGSERLDVPRDAGDEAAATDRHEHRGQSFLAVAEDLSADGPLPGDDERIVERMNERHGRLGGESVAMRLRVAVAVSREHDLGAHRARRVHLDPRRRLGHDDDRTKTERARRERHALRVVAGARRNDAARPLVGCQVHDLVVGAANLEAEDRLQVNTN